MEVNEKQIKSLKIKTEKIAKEQGQPITGYVTEYTVMYMETGATPVISPRDSILYQYNSGSEPIIEPPKKEIKKTPKPKAKKRATASKKK